MKTLIKLKIGRNTYDITEEDQVMDNGSTVQLLTQSKEQSSWGRKPIPRLPKKAIKEISLFRRVEQEHGYGERVSIFSLKNKDES